MQPLEAVSSSCRLARKEKQRWIADVDKIGPVISEPERARISAMVGMG
jgi:hypothetical protein